METVKLAIVLKLVALTITASSALELEAELGSGYPSGAYRHRSAASSDATVALNQGQSTTLHFSVFSTCTVSVTNVAYTNDGGSDTISVSVDGTNIGSFQTVAESNAGHNWNVVRNSGNLGNSVIVASGTHTVRVTATTTDQYGVEIDRVSLLFDSECVTSIRCVDPPASIPSSFETCDNSSAHGSIVQRSVMTGCAEEDNVHVPVYFNNVTEFTLTTSLPRYASLTRANNREANFTNCQLTSRIIWMVGNDDTSSAEFSTSCSPLLSTFHVNNQTRDICGTLDGQNRQKIILTFTASGPSRGQVQSTIGSLLEVQFAQVTGTIVVEAAAYGRLNSWVVLGRGNFSSTSRSYTWTIPDLTWEEGNNKVRLTVVSPHSSTNAVGNLDYIKLEQREERGETEIAEIFNNGITIVKVIGKDFWWLHPQSMVVQDVVSGSRWSNVVYIRVSRKVPLINSWPEVFVLYQDGNSRILTFPPSGTDWIPFGSSVIIGQSDPDSYRPYAAISRVDFDPRTLRFTLFFLRGGQAVVNIVTNISTTMVTVSDITYATNASLPFATFRSMWVSDGNADVDHVRSETSVQHITRDTWTSLTGRNFLFFRTCVSQHNTLSPDIRIEVSCITDSAAPNYTTTATDTTSIPASATTTMVVNKTTVPVPATEDTSSAEATSSTEAIRTMVPTTVTDSEDKDPASSEIAVRAENHMLLLLLTCVLHSVLSYLLLYT